jgi:ATP-dependent helicase/nuclease subunit B
VEGEHVLTSQNYTLTARADRIDLAVDGTSAAIIDYKSGGQYTQAKMEDGRLPQLPLEALIVEAGGFAGIKSIPVADLSYWILRGAKEGGGKISLSDPAKLRRAIDNAEKGLEALIETFDRQETAYYSLPRPHNIPAYNDYELLARVKEWTALDEGEAA